MSWFDHPMEARERQAWEKIRAKGQAHCIFVRFMLGWGLFVAAFWTAWMEVWDAGWSVKGIVLNRVLTCAILAAIGLPIGGVLLGCYHWWNNERRYLRLGGQAATDPHPSGTHDELH